VCLLRKKLYSVLEFSLSAKNYVLHILSDFWQFLILILLSNFGFATCVSFGMTQLYLQSSNVYLSYLHDEILGSRGADCEIAVLECDAF
jgi:hypothetical protein